MRQESRIGIEHTKRRRAYGYLYVRPSRQPGERVCHCAVNRAAHPYHHHHSGVVVEIAGCRSLAAHKRGSKGSLIACRGPLARSEDFQSFRGDDMKVSGRRQCEGKMQMDWVPPRRTAWCGELSITSEAARRGDGGR